MPGWPFSSVVRMSVIAGLANAFREFARSVSQVIVISDAIAARDRVGRKGTIARADAMLC
jgi:hypothetical protein